MQKYSAAPEQPVSSAQQLVSSRIANTCVNWLLRVLFDELGILVCV